MEPADVGQDGTTETHKSSAFLGFTNNLAAAVYIFGDSPPTPGEICSSPLRPPCYSGNLYGGTEPARSWFAAMNPVANNFGPTSLPPIDEKYARGSQNGQVPEVVGLSQSAATSRLQASGFTVNSVTTASGARAGTVTGVSPSGSAIPGSTVTIYISDGSVRAPAAPASPAAPAAPAPGATPPGCDSAGRRTRTACGGTPPN